MNFLDYFRSRKPNTASVAKERLQIIVAHERTARDQPDYLPQLQQDLISVISKYVAIDKDMVQAKLQKRAARVGFDWDSWRDVLVKMEEEKNELIDAVERGDRAHVADELGDLLFCCVNLARFLEVDPETALRGANRKFERRFRFIEQTLAERGRAPQEASLEEMEALWVEAKTRE